MKKEPKPSPLPESVEESAKKYVQNGEMEIEPGTIASYRHEGFIAGYQHHQTHHSAEVERLRKKHDQIRQVWTDTNKSITKLKEAIKQYVSDKGDDYETFEADYLD
jgi:flagellar biosynthesis chaperone FliJ